MNTSNKMSVEAVIQKLSVAKQGESFAIIKEMFSKLLQFRFLSVLHYRQNAMHDSLDSR